MATAARERIARKLRGDAQSAFSTELTVRTDDLSLEVDGYGRLKFPVTPSKARKLVGLGLPARFGRGVETLTDPEVRDTWEIPKDLVRAEWNDATLKDILATVKEELGLPYGAELTAELHSLLIYEPGQFFLDHQDSEKDDSMIGTLVVTLPSRYTGGELKVGLGEEERKTYRGSTIDLSVVAFYADCRHEVLKVQSGYRITLTYNLLLHGDTNRAEGEDGDVGELATLLREHFGTPVPRNYGGLATDPPNRLVYLLDHEYTTRGLNWQRLKGADATRVPLLLTAADKAGCEAVLALADINTTHGAFPANEGYGYRRYRGWYEDYDEEQSSEPSDGDREYEIGELIHSQVSLTHWTGPDGGQFEEIVLPVRGEEVCASNPTADIKPYSSEYQGYMGNDGNTLDRWYHRAAVVVWPREQAFANRAESSPAWALDQLTAMASSGDVPGAQIAAATLAPFWSSALHDGTAEEKAGMSRLLGKALRAANAVEDAEIAAMLLRPFRIEHLTGACVMSLGNAITGYGQRWAAERLQAWFAGQQRTWAHGGGWEQVQWIADWLPSLCVSLRDMSGACIVAAQLLVDLAWERIGKQIGTAIASPSPSHRDGQLSDLGRPFASVLLATTAIGAHSTRHAICGYIHQQPDTVMKLETSALRAAVELSPVGIRDDAGFGDLATDCAVRLQTRLARPQRAAGDWSIELPAGGCACELCHTLGAFLRDPERRTLEWPIAQQRRQHVHSRIDVAELPVTHVTRRQGSPFTLVLHKTDALLAREQQARARDKADLNWLRRCARQAKPAR
jgi:hypothetical protein